MNNNKLVSVILTGLFLVVFAGILPTATNAQQGRYVNVYSKNQVKGYIDKLESSSNRFRLDFDRYMDQSNINGTPTEDQFNGYVTDYARSLDRLKNQYNNMNSWWDNRNNVQQMISSAQPVNQMMINLAFAKKLENQWRNMRDDINKVADTFDMPGLNGGGWNGGGWNGGGNGNGNMSRPPSWAVGTFYSTDGGNITLTFAADGRASVVNNGQTFYGTYYRNSLYLNGDISTVSQSGNGIRTYNKNLGQYTNYSRNGNNNGGGWNGGNNGGNNGGGWNGNGNMSRPPSWAVGTFYSEDGSNLTLTVGNDGNVVLATNGQTYYGKYYQDAITLNGDTSTVSQNGSGIKTLNRSNGQTTYYKR